MAWTELTPGAPTTSAEAIDMANEGIRGMLGGNVDDNAGRIGPVAEYIVRHHDVTIETNVGAAGAPVRRYVLRGAWEPVVVELTPEVVSASLVAALQSVTEARNGDMVKVEKVSAALRRAASRLGVAL